MKRFLAVILMVFLMVGCFPVYAESIDLSAMSEEELKALIDDARLELTKYHPAVVAGTVLYEDENIKITVNGEIVIDDYDNMSINVIIENYSNMNLIISTANTSCNGWDIGDGTVSVSANKKAKDTFEFYDAAIDAELESAEDVEDITCSIHYFDEDTFEFSADSEVLTWTF